MGRALNHERINSRERKSTLHGGYLGRYNPVLDGKMPWGKHKLKRFTELPQDYLDWAVMNISDIKLRERLDQEWLRRYKEKDKTVKKR
jgi:hypothetical protein